MYVFVYGTLKRGYGNNRLLQSAKFIDSGVTMMPYRILGTGGFPVVLNEKEHRIAGEVYEIVTKRDLPRLDGLEGYPYMYYRKKVMVELNTTGIKIAAQMYVGTPSHWELSVPHLQRIMADENGVAAWNARREKVS